MPAAVPSTKSTEQLASNEVILNEYQRFCTAIEHLSAERPSLEQMLSFYRPDFPSRLDDFANMLHGILKGLHINDYESVMDPIRHIYSTAYELDGRFSHEIEDPNPARICLDLSNKVLPVCLSEHAGLKSLSIADLVQSDFELRKQGFISEVIDRTKRYNDQRPALAELLSAMQVENSPEQISELLLKSVELVNLQAQAMSAAASEMPRRSELFADPRIEGSANLSQQLAKQEQILKSMPDKVREAETNSAQALTDLAKVSPQSWMNFFNNFNAPLFSDGLKSSLCKLLEKVRTHPKEIEAASAWANENGQLCMDRDRPQLDYNLTQVAHYLNEAVKRVLGKKYDLSAIQNKKLLNAVALWLVENPEGAPI